MDSLFAESELEKDQPKKAYTVLARKYRPANLDELIGQEALVRTLKNAIATGRLAHAYLLTGIRGVGKTTTARIMARVLNNIPADQSVDSHIDVIEMDAASHTGVDNIREIIEEAKYKPLSAPYKIYIIDEVHMLSKGAFNALLKTLEEPPAHVKFIFATTEVRKVPVTILSRCQRFDLRRVEAEVLCSHLASIAEKEGVKVDSASLMLIAACAEGSVRDSLSLFDQAIAYCGSDVDLAKVQEMLGFADKTQIIELFETLVNGQIANSLEIFGHLSATSAETTQIVSDMLEFCHLVTRVKITPDLKPVNITASEHNKALEIAGQIEMAQLSRVWQMLLKTLADVKQSSHPKQSAEMGLIRIAYAADLPPLSEVVHDVKKNSSISQPRQREVVKPVQAEEEIKDPKSFADIVALFKQKGELLMASNLRTDVHLVSFASEKLEIRLAASANKDIPTKLSNNLSIWLGKPWFVTLSNTEGQPTLAEQEVAQKQQLIEAAKEDDMVKQLLAHFPDAEVKEVRQLEQPHKQSG
jgi:DNA polymerase-3 subunit gamma/tau